MDTGTGAAVRIQACWGENFKKECTGTSGTGGEVHQHKVAFSGTNPQDDDTHGAKCVIVTSAFEPFSETCVHVCVVMPSSEIS